MLAFKSRYYPKVNAFDLIAFLLLIPSAILGLFISSRVLRKLPARCPQCDGRAYYTGGMLGSSTQPRPYHCIDCGATIDQSKT